MEDNAHERAVEAARLALDWSIIAKDRDDYERQVVGNIVSHYLSALKRDGFEVVPSNTIMRVSGEPATAATPDDEHPSSAS